MTINNPVFEQDLRSYIRLHLPALIHLGADIAFADLSRVDVIAPLTHNHNDKGTVFGGSQYLLAVSSAWALVWLNAREAGIYEPDLIGVEGSIRYLKPAAKPEVIARAEAHAEDIIAFRQAINDKNKAVIQQHATIVSDGVASEFKVKFILKPLV